MSSLNDTRLERGEDDSVHGGRDSVVPKPSSPVEGDITCNACESVQARDFLLATGSHGVRLPLAEDAMRPDGARCQRCEILPAPIQGPGTLYLRFPLTHTLNSAREALQKTQWKSVLENNILRVVVNEVNLTPILDVLALVMTPREREDVKVFFLPQGQQPQLEDYFGITPFTQFHALVGGDWLLELMRERRLRSVFQPIVHAQDKHIFGYECLMRGVTRDGKPIGATAILNSARDANLMFQLDLEARRIAITSAASHDIREKIFINFGPTAIYDPINCLKSTLELVDQVGLKHEQVVFEVIEVDHLGDDAQLERIVNYYRDHGFGVALDDLGSGYASLLLLHRLRPEYVKLDRELARGVHHDRSKALLATKLLDVAHDLELLTIAEGIESPEEYEWVRDHGANFVQGYYIAHPALEPPAVDSNTMIAA